MKLLLILGALAVSAPLHAQVGVRPPQGWSLGIFGGGAAFTDFQRSNVMGVGFSIEGQPLERELPRSVGAQTTGVLAAAIGFWPSTDWGVRVRGAYAPTRFETVIPQADAHFLNQPRPALTGSEFRPLSIASYDAQVLIRMPTIRHRVMPYGILGGGVVRYALRSGDEPIPAEAIKDFEDGAQTNPSVSFGLGAMLGLRPHGWALQFELLDHLSRTPVRGSQEDSVNMTSSLTFMVGASWAPRK